MNIFELININKVSELCKIKPGNIILHSQYTWQNVSVVSWSFWENHFMIRFATFVSVNWPNEWKRSRRSLRWKHYNNKIHPLQPMFKWLISLAVCSTGNKPQIIRLNRQQPLLQRNQNYLASCNSSPLNEAYVI